jgi:hypothetical protein
MAVQLIRKPLNTTNANNRLSSTKASPQATGCHLPAGLVLKLGQADAGGLF